MVISVIFVVISMISLVIPVISVISDNRHTPLLMRRELIRNDYNWVRGLY